MIEGRDIGTVVAPDAEVKIYLNADPTMRARRRQVERPDIGGDALATDLRLRDQSDAARMRPAADAEQIDTTDLEVDDVVTRIEELVQAAPRRVAGDEPHADSSSCSGGRSSPALTRIVAPLRVYGRDRIPRTARSCSASTTSPGSTPGRSAR